MRHRIEDDDESRRQLKRQNGALIGENLFGLRAWTRKTASATPSPRGSCSALLKYMWRQYSQKLSESGLCAEILRTLGLKVKLTSTRSSRLGS